MSAAAHPLADMLERDHSEWRALVATLDAHPYGPLHDPESPTWEAKDVYAHLSRWINHSTDKLEGRLTGTPVPDPDGADDEINARWQGEDAALTFAEARAQAHAAFHRRIAAIEAVPARRWDNPLIAVAHADGYQHYAGHRRYIEAASQPT